VGGLFPLMAGFPAEGCPAEAQALDRALNEVAGSVAGQGLPLTDPLSGRSSSSSRLVEPPAAGPATPMSGSLSPASTRPTVPADTVAPLRDAMLARFALGPISLPPEG
jgi:hypothetical protein